MKLELRKITNGYICSIDGRETFHDVPESICGQLSEMVLEECQRLVVPKTYGDAAAGLSARAYSEQMQIILGQAQAAEAQAQISGKVIKPGDVVRVGLGKLGFK